MQWIYETLRMEPSCLSVSRYQSMNEMEGGAAHSGVYYITQWHGSVPLSEKLDKFSNGTIGMRDIQDRCVVPDMNVIDIFSRARVGNFETVFDYFCTAHEFCHALLKNQSADSATIDDEARCDLFGSMSSVEHFGRQAVIPVLQIMNEMRRATQKTDKLHATSPALSAYLSQDSHPSLPAREAFLQAKRIASENRPALQRSFGQPVLKLIP
jgi:hypothetical protein